MPHTTESGKNGFLYEAKIPSNMTDKILDITTNEQLKELFYVTIYGPSGYIDLSTGQVEERFAEKFGSAIHVEEENNERIQKRIDAFRL